MTQQIQEYFDSRGVDLRVDEQAGVIRGVKILGLESRNGRTYSADALTGARHLYDGAKVNVNHPQGDPLSPRDYRDRIGVIRGVEVREGEGLFGSLYFNPKHALAEQLVWDAQRASENVGFSHNVRARVANKPGGVIVEEILQVQSVDLVADPATTRGLFEHADPNALPAETMREIEERIAARISEQHERELASIQAELDVYKAREAIEQKRSLVKKLLAEFKLPDPDNGDATSKAVVSEQFVSELMAADDEREMRGLVRDRAQLVRSLGITSGRGRNAGPVSRDQTLIDHQEGSMRIADGKSFAMAIT